MYNITRYLTVMMIGLILAMASAWWYSAHYRQHFSKYEYGIYQAKLEMLDKCDVGRVVILGDSRAGMAYDPAVLGNSVRNFALTSHTAIEGYYLAKKILACPSKPATFVLAYSPDQFNALTWFWTNSIQMGLLTETDLDEISSVAAQTRDRNLYKSDFGSEPPPRIKNWLYAHDFPAYDFAAITGAMMDRTSRYKTNIANYGQVLRDKGLIVNPIDNGCANRASPEAGPIHFSPSPIVNSYYAKLIDLLQENHVNTIIAPLPYSKFTYDKISIAYAEQFINYNNKLIKNKSRIYMSDEQFFPMDNCLFSDEFHVNAKGAKLFSLHFKPALEGTTPLAPQREKPHD